MKNGYGQEQCFRWKQREAWLSSSLWGMSNQRTRIDFLGWRRVCGLSQEELAERMGYSRSAIAKAETRPYNVTIAFLEAFAEAVGAPGVAALFQPPHEKTDRGLDLYRYFSEIDDPQNRDAVIAVAKGFADKSRAGFTHEVTTDD